MSSIISAYVSTTWEDAIKFCEEQLKDAKAQRAKQLQAAISTFRANQKRGIPWPGTQESTNQTATQN